MQKHVNLVDRVKSFPTNIFLQNLASIEKRTSPVKFAHLAEKSEKGSTSNLSTKVLPAPLAGVGPLIAALDVISNAVSVIYLAMGGGAEGDATLSAVGSRRLGHPVVW